MFASPFSLCHIHLIRPIFQTILYDFGDLIEKGGFAGYPKGIPDFGGESSSPRSQFFEKVILNSDALADLIRDLLLGVDVGDIYNRQLYAYKIETTANKENKPPPPYSGTDEEMKEEMQKRAKKREDLDILAQYLTWAYTNYCHSMASEEVHNLDKKMRQRMLDQIKLGIQQGISHAYCLYNNTFTDRKMSDFLMGEYYPKFTNYFDRVSEFLMPLFYHKMHATCPLITHRHMAQFTLKHLTELIECMKFEDFDYRDLFLATFMERSYWGVGEMVFDFKFEGLSSAGVRPLHLLPKFTLFQKFVIFWEETKLDINDFNPKRDLMPFSTKGVDVLLNSIGKGRFQGLYDSICRIGK